MNEHPWWEHRGIAVAHAIGDCWHCHRPTRFIDLDFQTFLHPGACQDAKVNEWIAATVREYTELQFDDTDGEEPPEVREVP